MGGAERVVGNFIRAGTCRCSGAARVNGLVCSVATGEPATVSENFETCYAKARDEEDRRHAEGA